MRIRRGGPWGFLDTLVGAVISGLSVMSYISSYGNRGRAYIACASPQSYVVWGYGANIAVPRESHG